MLEVAAMDKILIATKNAGKAREFARLFAPKQIEVMTLLDLEDVPPIEENGQTFTENALIKAQTISNYLHIPVLADDSGLVVDALDGEPGIYSARYAGDHDDAANNRKLLNKLEDVAPADRTAHFHCSIVVVQEGKEPLIAMGDAYGQILTAPRGRDGFGYDPLFYYPAKDKTFAEMTASEKNTVSHRGLALQKLLQGFDQWWQ